MLANKRTASAAEFLCGVFQDSDNAIIIGTDESTLGKGIGQREFQLPNNGALKLTYHEFYTPSGRCVQRQYKNASTHTRLNADREGKIFYTKNGRVINDRAGIEVDYMVEPKLSLLNSVLSSSGAYFAFATEFSASQNQASYGKHDFVVNDEVYARFKAYVLEEVRQGNLNLLDYFDDQHLLENIAQLSDEMKRCDSTQVQTSLGDLRRQVVQDLLSDFESCKEIIRFELEQNILARKLSQSELIRRSLRYDDLVKEAVRIIDDSSRFRSLLAKSND